MIESAVKSFFTKGYGVIPNVFSEYYCQKAVNQINKLIDEYEPTPETMLPFSTEHDEFKRHDYYLKSGGEIRFFMEQGAYKNGKMIKDKRLAINKLGHGLHQKNQVIKKIVYQKVVKEICNKIGIVEPQVLQTVAILKLPLIGAKVMVHQDSTFLHDKPLSLTGFWVPLQDATLQNGCLWGLPGSQNGKLYYRAVMDWQRKFSDMRKLHEKDYDENLFEPIQMKKGSLAFFNGLWLHKSQANTSLNSRYALVWHLKQKKNQWPKQNWLQRDQFADYEFNYQKI